MSYRIEFDREIDGRWIAEIEELDVLVYDDSQTEAETNAKLAADFAIEGWDL